MCWPLIAAGVVAVIAASNAKKSGQAEQAVAGYNAQVERNDAQVSEWQAQDATARGAVAEQSQRLQTAQFKGKQVAALGDRGVALDEGSPLAILAGTDYMGERDALTVRDNAAREAYGFRNEGAAHLQKATLYDFGGSLVHPNEQAVSAGVGSFLSNYGGGFGGTTTKNASPGTSGTMSNPSFGAEKVFSNGSYSFGNPAANNPNFLTDTTAVDPKWYGRFSGG